MNINESGKKLEKHGNLYHSIIEHYNKEVVGQDHVKKLMAKILSDIHQDLDNKKWKPLSVLFFKWPTGVGKTEIVKQTAELLFGDKLWVTIINCEQLRQDYEWFATLFWSPKWYVGYGEAPLLDPKYIYSSWINASNNGNLHKIAQNKTHLNIVLFDEIEKMHPKTIQSLLSILDEGVINLKNGKTTYFNNSIIIFTSNVGESDAQQTMTSVGFGSNSEKDSKKKQEVKDQLFEQFFSPEFRGRLDHIVEFEPLDRNFLDNLINKYKKNLICDVLDLTHQKIMVQYWSNFNDYIKQQVSDNKWYRNIDKIRDSQVRKAVGSVIKINRLQNYSQKHILQIFIEDNEIEFELKRELHKNEDLVIANENWEIEWYLKPKQINDNDNKLLEDQNLEETKKQVLWHIIYILQIKKSTDPET